MGGDHGRRHVPTDENAVGGPLHWADEMGLDRVPDDLECLKKSLGSRFLPHHLLNKYVHAGSLGKKRSEDFFCTEGLPGHMCSRSPNGQRSPRNLKKA